MYKVPPSFLPGLPAPVLAGLPGPDGLFPI